MVERLPSVQLMIPGSWDRVPAVGGGGGPASPSPSAASLLVLSQSLSLNFFFKLKIYKQVFTKNWSN